MTHNKTMVETHNYIVLEQYTKGSLSKEEAANYQTDQSLMEELIRDLKGQGYEYSSQIVTPEDMLKNVRLRLETLNDVKFNDEEWKRFCDNYLDKASDSHTDRMKKIHKDYIYDFVFNDGHIKNIYLLDKKNIMRNKLEVISRYEKKNTGVNNYDVTILVNGLPLVQVELKKSGAAIREAFNQKHRYSKEGYNSVNSLYKYLQMFVISNGTNTRYFANTVKRDMNSFNFTMNWSNSKNELIKDIKDFTSTFFDKNTLLNILINYSVFDSSEKLLIMRPYQIAATERILGTIKSAYHTKKWSTLEGSGYIWHTTGSGKTLTSFKAARLATELDFIDKVFFVVDRKDLDYQTMKEYQSFSPDSVNGSENTQVLKRNIDIDDNKIIVTTIQKLNNLIKVENDLAIYNRQVVFIFDEAHRSQFGEAQKNIQKKFKMYYKFGFTGTPILRENALGAETTESVFGRTLHSYVITDAIRDEKVLKFKVDYNDVRPKFKSIETEQDDKILTAAENKEALLHPERIREISQYILDNYRLKTNRTNSDEKGFTAMFAVSSVDAAKAYYESFRELQKDNVNPLKITTIFSFSSKEEENAVGEIVDETFEPAAMDNSAKEFLSYVIDSYNEEHKTNFGLDSKSFQNYYRDLANRVKNKEVDLLIVVGMFLTGFDAPTVNTLFVDKNLRYHGLIQAFSRTNRIYDTTKSFGNIVTFRDLEQSTKDAIKLFCDDNTKDVVLEKSYREYMDGYIDAATGQVKQGYKDIVINLKDRFANIQTDKDKKDFAKLFGEYLRTENILQNYDEFKISKRLKKLDLGDIEKLEEFKRKHCLTDEEIVQMKDCEILSDSTVRSYLSTYNDIREWVKQNNMKDGSVESNISWDDIIFEVDLLKSQEINLDYILELIFVGNKEHDNKDNIVGEIRHIVRSSSKSRAKESLIVDYIYQTDLNQIKDKVSFIEEFYEYAQIQQQNEVDELIRLEGLIDTATKHYIRISLKRGSATENGTELNETLPKMSPLNPEYRTKKKRVFQKICDIVEKYMGIGGEL